MKPALDSFNQPQLDRRKVLTGVLFGSAALLAYVRRPRARIDYLGKDRLEALIPEKIGPWNYVAASGLVVPPEDPFEKLIYAQVLTRIYSDGANAPVMLLIAQNGSQAGFLQIHRPEVCYAASGYQISSVRPHPIAIDGKVVPANWMDATAGGPTEHVVYWTRIGDEIPVNWQDQRLAVAEQNLMGVIPDAVLVRVSTVAQNTEAALTSLDQFVAAMVASIPNHRRSVLVV